MINFRYHLVSIVAVFLALGIGVIMGTAVIDSAVVDRLESQQAGLQSQIAEVRGENDELRTELSSLREARDQLAAEGSERLLDGALRGAPVLVVGVRGAEPEGLSDLQAIIQTADAEYQGTLWLTDRFALDDQAERRDLATVLGFEEDASAASLRSAAISRLALLLRQAPSVEPPAPEGAPAAPSTGSQLVAALQDAGFIDLDDLAAGQAPDLPPSTRVVVLSGEGAALPDEDLILPFVRQLVRGASELPPAPVLAIDAITPADDEDDTTWLAAIRGDERLTEQVATVDNIDEFAGRLAAVLALQDLAEPRVGHYGRADGAQRLLPPAAE